VLQVEFERQLAALEGSYADRLAARKVALEVDMRRQLEALRQEQAQLEAQVQEQVTGWLAPGAAANACPDTAACPDTSRRPPQAARTPPPPPPPPPRPQIKAARAQLDAPPVTPQEVAERRFKARMEVEESCRQASAPGGGLP
jgi:hypothetical protein